MQWPICIIGSCDYCHAPLGVSSFSFSIQNVWEMTTVVYKIACCLCTACPPAIVLKLSIADTISSATVLYIANTLKLFVRGKNTALCVNPPEVGCLIRITLSWWVLNQLDILYDCYTNLLHSWGFEIYTQLWTPTCGGHFDCGPPPVVDTLIRCVSYTIVDPHLWWTLWFSVLHYTR